MCNPLLSFEARLRRYRWVWMLAIVATLGLRFTLFGKSPEISRFYLFLIFSLGTWLSFMLLHQLEIHRLQRCLAAYHPLRRDFFGWRALLWHCSHDDFGDSHLVALRRERHRFTQFSIAMLCSYFVMFLVVVAQ